MCFRKPCARTLSAVVAQRSLISTTGPGASTQPTYSDTWIRSWTSSATSAIYWCQRPPAAERYLLVVWLSDSAVANAFKCPRTIAWRNYPGGLRVFRHERLALSDFWYREDPKHHGPSDAVTDGPVIESEYDGVGARFFCHAGTWLVQQLH